MKRLNFNLFIVLLLTILFPSIVDAKIAYSIGTSYADGLDTSLEVTRAAEAYYSMGYSSYYNLKPDYSYLNGYSPVAGKKRLESEIIFLAGHGNYDNMYFNYNGNGGSYNTGIYYGNSFLSDTGVNFVGLNSLNLAETEMIIFAGCQTAAGTNNLGVQAMMRGAQYSLGWIESVEDSSMREWTKNFNNALVSGNAFLSAWSIANQYSYNDNRVKTARYYVRTAKSTTMQIPLRSDNLNILFKDEKDLIAKVEKYIHDEIDSTVTLDAYFMEKNGANDVLYYDFKYMMGDILTNSAFTVVTSKNYILKIVDNRKDLINDIAFDKIKTLPSEEVILMSKKRIDSNHLEIKEQKIYKEYDIDTKKIQYVVLSTIYEKNTKTYYVDKFVLEL